jgi:hypothetical protein
VKLAGYIDVGFAEWVTNTQIENFYVLIGKFSRFAWDRKFNCNGGEEFPFVIDFEMRQTAFFEQDLTGWVVAVWLGAWGKTEAEAKGVWLKGLSFIGDFLRAESVEESQPPCDAP